MEQSGQFSPPSLRKSPRRVVSLVPSQTESLFELGLGDVVVGITDYCMHPRQALTGLPRLGGPKNPDVNAILDLTPDLVLANWEENTFDTVDHLQKAGIPVWVSFPQTVRQSLQVLWELAGLFHNAAAFQRVKTLEMALEWEQASAGDRLPVRCFCPVWYDRTQAGDPWWMTFNEDTYCHDLLAVCGAENVFARRERRFPLAADLDPENHTIPASQPHSRERDTRYPRVGLDEVVATQPELILLPDEPFPFAESHRQEMLELFSSTPAGITGRVHLVDGSLITWHGVRLAHALRELPRWIRATPHDFTEV